MSEAGQRLGVDIATNFMLMTLFNIVAGTAEDPDGFRADVKKALLDLVDQYSLQGVAPETAKEARDAAKLVIAGILQDTKPFKQ